MRRMRLTGTKLTNRVRATDVKIRHIFIIYGIYRKIEMGPLYAMPEV